MADLVSALRRFGCAGPLVQPSRCVIVMPGLVAKLQMRAGDGGGGGGAAPARHGGGGGPHRQRGRATPPPQRPQRRRPLAPRTSPLWIPPPARRVDSSAISCLHFSTCSLTPAPVIDSTTICSLLINSFLFYVLGDHLAPLSNINALSTAHKNQIRNCLAQVLNVW